jgi:hypothetical protein
MARTCKQAGRGRGEGWQPWSFNKIHGKVDKVFVFDLYEGTSLVINGSYLQLW